MRYQPTKIHACPCSTGEVPSPHSRGWRASRSSIHIVLTDIFRMAGAAGFEPAVPGLGGQCIIQAMLHARSREHALLKKCAPEKLVFPFCYPMPSSGESPSRERGEQLLGPPQPVWRRYHLWSDIRKRIEPKSPD